MKKFKVENILVRKILDSAASWTIQTEVLLDDGRSGLAAVPSGISEGQWEAKTVPVKEAIQQIQKIIFREIKEREFDSQEELDRALMKSDCGANATLAVSLAFCRAAGTLKLPAKIILPKLMMLLMEGGKHGSGSLTIQEFLVIVKSVEEGVTAYQKLREFFKRRGWPITVGAEGGLSPAGVKDEKALAAISEVLGKNCRLALDIAQSSRENRPTLNFQKLVKDFPIVSLEDPCLDDDWNDWVKIRASLPGTLIVADDLVASNAQRIMKAAELKACGAVVIKPDQRRTLTEVLEAIRVAKGKGLKIIISHRGRETSDSFIADLALAVGADFVKFGAPARGERVAKYNRLLELVK